MKKLLWMAMMAWLVSGCGELSYKRGASTQDLEAAKAACRSSGSEKATEQCLEDKGWTVKKLDDVDLFASAGVSLDNRNQSVLTAPTFVPVTPAQPAAAAPSAMATAAAPAAEKPAVASRGSEASVGTVTRSSANSVAPQAAPPMPSAPAASPPPPSPLAVYTISSGWKIGAGREALAADTNDCVATLGEAHKPNAKTQQVTRGFVVCMHGKGWKALRAVAG